MNNNLRLKDKKEFNNLIKTGKILKNKFFVIGNGTELKRQDAFIITNNGDVFVSGNVFVKGNVKFRVDFNGNIKTIQKK